MMACFGICKQRRQSIVLLVLLAPLLLVACGGSQETIETKSHLTAPKVINEIESIKVSSIQPNGYLSPEFVISKLNYPVNDFTNTLSTSERKNLDSKIQTIYEEGILQVGVVVVPTTGATPIFDYAMKVADGWKLGSPENNNGLLILVALEDENMYILTGLDIEDKLSDSRVSTVIHKYIMPEFQQNKYAQGLSFGIDVLANDTRY